MEEFGEGFIEDDSPIVPSLTEGKLQSLRGDQQQQQHQHLDSEREARSHPASLQEQQQIAIRRAVQLEDDAGDAAASASGASIDPDGRKSQTNAGTGSPAPSAAVGSQTTRRKYTVPVHLFQAADKPPVANSATPLPLPSSSGAQSPKALFERRGLPSPSIEIPSLPKYQSIRSGNVIRTSQHHLGTGHTSGDTPSSTASSIARPLFPRQASFNYAPGSFTATNAQYAVASPRRSQAAIADAHYWNMPAHSVNPEDPTRTIRAASGVASPIIGLDNQTYSTRSGSAPDPVAYNRYAQMYGRNEQYYRVPAEAPPNAGVHPAPKQYPNGQRLAGQSSNIAIDLTEGDDEETAKSSGDEITITGEKMVPKPPKHERGTDDEDDDGFQVVGEKPSEKSAPLCIGQLTGVALILYPIPELKQTPDAFNPSLQVALLRTQPQIKPNGVRDETIKLYSSTTGTNFGVVEQRLANVLGPMITRDNKRGLGIWIEACVVRTNEKSVRDTRLWSVCECSRDSRSRTCFRSSCSCSAIRILCPTSALRSRRASSIWSILSRMIQRCTMASATIIRTIPTLLALRPIDGGNTSFLPTMEVTGISTVDSAQLARRAGVLK